MKNIDSVESLNRHRKIILNSKFLNSLYRDFYKEFKRHINKHPAIEIGSGAGFIKEIIPKTVTTDVVKSEGIDKIAFAEKLPFKDTSVGSIVMLNVFHHIKNPQKALLEFDRVLKPKGKIIMIEPTNTIWSKFIYTYFHNEIFDPKSGWITKGIGRMSDANGAIPWIVFVRDRNLFTNKFKGLRIKSIKLHTPFAYLASGGVSKFQPFNNFNFKKFRKIENLFKTLNPFLAMFMTILIEKE